MKYFYFLLIALIWIGCAASKEIQKSDESANKEVKYDESFDPLSLNDDDLDLPEVNLSAAPVQGSTLNNNSNIIPPQKETNGYRVQIIATQDLEKATLLEEEARNQFSQLGYEAYLIFEAPLYKIRIGDFMDRNKADDLKNIAKDYGYRESFIVRTKVFITNKDNQDF